MLLALLDPTSPYADYYSRLYSVQILSAVCAARPERLQECILSAPLGVSRLVGVLDDGKDAVRNAGLLLLIDLTSAANEELRKIVAFEDVFGKTFGQIRAEGGLGEAGITAQDCLSLLANLIKGSASNQTMFRESGCVNQMVQLLRQAFPPASPEAPFIAQGREKAAWGMLQLLALFLEPGEPGTAQNQQSFFRAGTTQVLIDLGFTSGLPTPVRASALKSIALLITNNPPLQETFAGLTVETASRAADKLKSPTQANGSRSTPSSTRGSARASAENPRTYIIEALLELTLKQPQEDVTMRTASCNLIQAYLTSHDRIKHHFLQRAIAGHAEHETAGNVLITLLHPGDDVPGVSYASRITAELVSDQLGAKTALAAVKEGNESEGEDVLTFIQALGSQLQDALQGSNERSVAAYAGLLVVFSWEFAEGVNDLLAEGSSLMQALVAAANPLAHDPVTAGLTAALLGAVYEFSTKDSPIPRRTLAPLLRQKLGRSKYLEAITQLRRHPVVRDFDFVDSDADTSTHVLSKEFVDLFMTEHSRLRKSIDKDPGLEVLPPSTAEEGVDRDILDDLRQQLQSVKDALSHTQQDTVAAKQQHDQDRLSSAKDLQMASAEVDRLRRINQAVQQGHESELEKLARQHELQQQQLLDQHQRALFVIKQDAERQGHAALQKMVAADAQRAQDYERRLAELGNAHRSEQTGHVETARQLEALTARHAELGTRERETSLQHDDLTQRHQKIAQEHQDLQAQVPELTAQLANVRSESEKRQELVMRFSAQIKELRDELKGKEDELATERAGFTELEKELEAAKSATQSKEAPPAADGLQERAERLEKQLADAKEGEKSAKEELESMLLYMDDIAANRDKYKTRLKELGGEATEDEEDDADEDEDEDEDGEEGGGE